MDLNKLKNDPILSANMNLNLLICCFHTSTVTLETMIFTRRCPEVLFKITVNGPLLPLPSFLLLDKIMDYHHVYFSAIISKEWAVLFDGSGSIGHRCARLRICVWCWGGGAGATEATGGHSGRNAKARGGGGGGGCSVVLMD